MNDQIPPWENNWRDTLADYEAPLQPTDWASMDALLDGGTPAPPESPGSKNTPGPTATASSGMLKGIFLTLGVVAVVALAYFLGRSAGGSTGPTTDVSIVSPDRTPNRAGEQETPRQKEEVANTSIQKDPRAGSSAYERGISSPVVQNPTLLPNTAPAAAPASNEPPGTQPTGQRPRVYPVYPILSRPPTGFPDFDELLRQRLQKAIREHPVELVYPPFNNGYFPPVKDQF